MLCWQLVDFLSFDLRPESHRWWQQFVQSDLKLRVLFQQLKYLPVGANEL